MTATWTESATTATSANRSQTIPSAAAPAAVPTTTGANDAGRVRGRAASTQTFTGPPATRARGVLSSFVTTYRRTTMPAAASRRLVALALPPGDEFIAELDAAWARGDAVMPIDPNVPISVAERLLAAMRPTEPVGADVALVILTSGSTGEPKGALLSHAALEASARATHPRIGREPGDRWLSCLPWQHIGGIQVMLRARLLGIPLTVHDHFDVDRFAACRRDPDVVGADPAGAVAGRGGRPRRGSGRSCSVARPRRPRCWHAPMRPERESSRRMA